MKKQVIVLIGILILLALVPSVLGKNVFYTTQELNRTPPDMGVSGYPAADIFGGIIDE